jgi:hypothetical protein
LERRRSTRKFLSSTPPWSQPNAIIIVAYGLNTLLNRYR